MASDHRSGSKTSICFLANGFHAGFLGVTEDGDWIRAKRVKNTIDQIDHKGSFTQQGALFGPCVYDEAPNSARLISPENGVVNLDDTRQIRATYAQSASRVQGNPNANLLTAMVLDDHRNNSTTTSRIPDPVLNQDLPVTGEIETSSDRDWFRVKLQSGHWYFAGLKGDSLDDVKLIVRDPDKEVVSDQAGGSFAADFFKAEKDGDYFVVARSNDLAKVGTYSVAVQERPRPTIVSQIQYLPAMPATSRPLAIHTNYQPVQRIQLFAISGDGGGYLKRKSVPQEMDVVHTFNSTDLIHWEWVSGTGNSQKVDRLYVRAKTAGQWSYWNRSHFQTDPDLQNSLWSGDKWFDPFSFETVYRVDSSLTAEQAKAVRKAFAHWGEAIAWTFTESGGPVKIRVSAADLGSEIFTTSGLPDPSAGVDIVLNSAKTEFDAPREGGMGFWKVLQAVGNSLGLNRNPVGIPSSFDNNHYTVMSNNLSPDHAGAYPSRPMLFDANVLNAPYAYGFPGTAASGNTTYRMSVKEPVVRSIVDWDGHDEINASGSRQSVSINLRPGQFSTLGDSIVKFVIAPGTRIERAVGGAANDELFGWANSELHGKGGDDILYGQIGDSKLFGGNGNDRYVYELGDSVQFPDLEDTIDERDRGGRDVVFIQSFFGLNNLQQDMSFQRIGNDLLINLDFNGGEYLTTEGSIRIKNMASNPSRVETLRLFNAENAPIGKDVSLVSVWAQLSDVDSTRERFRYAGRADRFGQLVKPV